MIDQRIKNLQSTTFCGQRFNRKQIVDIQNTVIGFPMLSRKELGHTICEHLRWFTPKGEYRIQFCLSVLQEMDIRGLFTLPAKVESKIRGAQKQITWTNKTDEQIPINGSLEELGPISLQVVTEKEERDLWNEFVERYHYLGYKRPIGSSLRYFIINRNGRKLGCLLFSFAVNKLPCRDEWIGWETKMRKKHLKLVVNNARFLIFPWVNVKYLASKSLSLATHQIRQDWETHHGYRPVLLETFVDPSKYKGTSYKAANWECIGQTAGVKQTKRVEGKSKKDIYVYPLTPHFRVALFKGEKVWLSSRKNSAPKQTSTLLTDDPFLPLWQKIIGVVNTIADDFDRKWQKRKRVLNTLLMVLFIFRLVLSKNKQGYGTTIVELWDQCRTMNVPLPQYKPLTEGAFCQGRKKLDETIFKILNTEVIRIYEKTRDEDRWNGHRMFAVEGSKVNLPRQLLGFGYETPNDQAHYPQGLVSVLYQLKQKIPIDFDLVAHNNERTMALIHLDALRKKDIVVYDRGYFSYVMLHSHITRGIDAVFRLPRKGYTIIEEFIKSNNRDQVVIIQPSSKREKTIHSQNPEIECIPLKLRLIKYVIAGITYTLGTTLLDAQRYKAEEFPDVYHSRWGIEALYKVSKNLMDVEDFHGQSERGVKQELFAHFILITLGRVFSNQAEDDINQNDRTEKSPKFNINFKSCLTTVARNLEKLFLHQTNLIKKTIRSIMSFISVCRQRQRPGRSYDRISKKPIGKWMPKKEKKASQAQTVTA